MDASIILSTYNRDHLLADTLKSFCSMDISGINFEIIVVDNADRKETQILVNSYKNLLPVICLVQPIQGKNVALNTAIPHASGDLLVFTDDDIIADSKWLKELIDGSCRWKDAKVFGGRIIPYFNGKDSPIAQNHHYFDTVFGCADWGINEGFYSPEKVWGANLAIRSTIFKSGIRYNENVGPKGANYIMGSETDLVWRLFKIGHRPVYLPGSLVYHQIREEQLTISWINKRFFRMGRTEAYEKYKDMVPDGVLWGNVPRYYYRELIELFVKKINPFLSAESRQNAGFDFHFRLGIVHQLRLK